MFILSTLKSTADGWMSGWISETDPDSNSSSAKWYKPGKVI